MTIQELAKKQGVELLAFYKEVALCDKGRGVHQFVTWRFDEDGFFWGHYADTLENPEIEFKERIAAR
jgi:hypothetical protein